jgi:predicted ABC-class ATPase
LRGLAKYLLAGRRLRFIQRLEIGVRQIDLAAHLDDLGNVIAQQPVRDDLHRLDVSGYIFAFGAIPARRRLDEPATLVAQRNRKSVDLGFRRERKRCVVIEAQETADAGDELGHILGS